RKGGHRFAGTGLADQRHGLVRPDVEGDAVDREQLALALTERDRELVNGKERIRAHDSRSISPEIPGKFASINDIPLGSLSLLSAERSVEHRLSNCGDYVDRIRKPWHYFATVSMLD